MIESNSRTLHRCIFCLEEKPAAEFNREHVVPRMMGTYDGSGPVLSHYEVCRECNSYFSIQLENEIALDSYEALIRIINGRLKNQKNRKLGSLRIKATAEYGPFSDMPLHFVSNSNESNGVELVTDSFIAFFNGYNPKTKKENYNFYTLKTIPHFSEELFDKLCQTDRPIWSHGYSKEEMESALLSKGYNCADMDFGKLSNDELSSDWGKTAVRCYTDRITWRVAAKVMINYLCHTYGKLFALQSSFDNLRAYARYGIDNGLGPKFSYIGKMPGMPFLAKGDHAIGTAFSELNGYRFFCGFVSWGNKISYVFPLCPISDLILDFELKSSCVVCNNSKRCIQKIEANFHISWPRTDDDIKGSKVGEQDG